MGQPIADRSYGCPGAITSVKVAIDEDACADVARLLDMWLEAWMHRQLAGVVVVEIAHRCAAPEQPEQGGAVAVERDVERGHRITCLRVDTFEQRDIALHAGHERGFSGLDEAQLLQRAQAVSVAVKGVEASHLKRSWDPNGFPLTRD